ncbi:hypothetical protein MIMGU_mgv1a024213mg [Erythranthe guttata]|uniref:Endoplasmic reticulum transmembrane protein n=1 Tax=Erythranthe guttata TaxID=4155 RepID=A0A022RFR6_ERYGU|nr:hypothetical protein MIMGU_mgv1a024213mg [Erythranthe guttata]
MIPLFFIVVFVESVIAAILMVEIGPLRELVMKGLDQVKMRRATVLTVAGTIFVILLSNLFSIIKIQNQGSLRTNLLGGTLMVFSLFLGFILDRMHHYMQNLIEIRGKTGTSKLEIEKLEKEKQQLKEKEEKAAAEVKRLQKEITENLNKHKLELTEKSKLVETAETHVASLQRQTADLLLEYDRLLEDNQNLQNHARGYKR